MRKTTGSREIFPNSRVDILTGIICTIALAITIAVLVVHRENQQFDLSHVGKRVCIQYEVNLMVKYSPCETVITTLHKGDSVTLTGYSYNDFVGTDSFSTNWTEVRTEGGTVGWIVTSSIQWA